MPGEATARQPEKLLDSHLLRRPALDGAKGASMKIESEAAQNVKRLVVRGQRLVKSQN